MLKVYPSVKLMMAISAPAVPGAAEAVRQAGRKDVNVIGLSLPNINKPYVHDGVVQTVVLWNTRDLGYLAVYASALGSAAQADAGARDAPGRTARAHRRARQRDHPRSRRCCSTEQHRAVRFLERAKHRGHKGAQRNTNGTHGPLPLMTYRDQ